MDRAKYEAMRTVLLAVLPKAVSDAMKVADAIDALRPNFDQALFPGG